MLRRGLLLQKRGKIMSYYLVVFRAKSESMRFQSLISSYGAMTTIISTPRKISVSCGISVKIRSIDLNLAKTILSRRQFYTFAGIYLINNDEYIKI